LPQKQSAPGAIQAADAGLVWFRRDLRHYDNAALRAALVGHAAVHCAFVFDTEILEPLQDRDDRRVTFIYDTVDELRNALAAAGGALHVVHGRAREEIPRLAQALGVAAVYASRDYEPEAIARDDDVANALRNNGIRWHDVKDQVIFELDEVRTRAGGMFAVFTPYRNAWLARLDARDFAPHDIAPYRHRLVREATPAMPSLEALGFARATLTVAPGMSGGARLWTAFRERLAEYGVQRDFPALASTSGLSAHLRFCTVSIRELVGDAARHGSDGARLWLSELIWREFFFSILAAKPHVVDAAFRPAFDRLRWNDDSAAFDAWVAGRTGYPLVDAAMRELAAQGTMHNRLRMVSASFLVKHLGIDWRRGERHFARKLLDYDLAANNGNWQWCASTGADGQPWFRVFNPVTQSQRFDPDGIYLRRWLPELAHVPVPRRHAPWEMTSGEQQACRCVIGVDYPQPIVDHAEARKMALARYSAVASPRKASDVSP